ncbi:UvrD-helicase domain-containing protein [Butyrivibrio sp. VCD2006]|uniref:UvrD-helicase domain-containing protein n=1 Tax=Butyrivibrio sp. VCD2006 TaxID=1280664 RepID=UPI0003FB0CF6|nr:UvrD-helicase domain-containing protein [Butyrivibrio sp. VCD2006]
MSNMNNALEKDTESRNKIISEINTNFFVEAGAGSGKTTMLVSRMVAMVEAGIDISKICAITFTKAAAGEFYERFQKLLIERSNPDYKWEDKGYAGQLPEPTEETRKLCETALQNIDLCFMGTIDSFCSMILSEHPSEAGIPSDSQIVSDTDVDTIFKQEYVKICDGEYGKDLADAARAFRAMHYGPEAVFVRGMSLFMNNRNVHFNYDEMKSLDIDKEFSQERESLIAALKCLIEHPELKYDAEKGSVEAWEKIGDIYKKIKGRWSNNFTGAISGMKQLKKLRVLPVGLEKYGASLGGMLEPGGKQGKWLDFVVTKEDGLFTRLQKSRYDISMSFLNMCIPIIEAAMLEKGNLTFFDYLYYLRNMLRKDAGNEGKLIDYIYNRHSYFLIDEFQDTNPMQAEVFFYLAAEKPVENWRDCVPKPGSLFIVGDPKQSIYRFRSADVASFLNVKKLFEKNKGTIAYLTRNFRSTLPVCGYFNRVFGEMLSEETENQSKYEEIPLADVPNEDVFQGIYTYKAYTGKELGEFANEADPIKIADIIERLVGREDYKLKSSSDKEPRPIKYSDFMVITAKKDNLAPIMAELDTRGIPAKVEGNVPFEENEALQAMHRLYAAIADPGDKIALYGALNGKILGLTKAEITAFKAEGGYISTGEIDKDSFSDVARKVADKLSQIGELQKEATRLSPAALFVRIMDEFRIYNNVEAENIEVIYYTLELIRNAEKAGLVITLEDGAKYLSKIALGESEEERCLSLNERLDCVHMANLHKVKGLEAPIVILAAASSRAGNASMRVVHKDTGAEGYLFALGGEKNEDGTSYSLFETSDFKDEKDAEKEALAAETQRLIYVAATRARNSLIICNSVGLRSGKEVSNCKWKPIIEGSTPDIFETINKASKKEKEKVEQVSADKLYDQAQSECALNDRDSETMTYSVESPSKLVLKSKLSDIDAADVNNMVPSDNSEGAGDKVKQSVNDKVPAALLGTMAHKFMEMLVSSKNQMDVSEAISEIIKEYRTHENERYEKTIADRLGKMAADIQNGGYEQTNGAPEDILGTLLSADEVYCEVPFCYKDDTDGTTIWNGVIDALYCKDGNWHIVDYKTNADGNELDEKYSAQLNAYVKAFKEITGEDADALTYHLGV